MSSDNPKDTPLEPLETSGAYVHNVIDLASIRIEHGRSKRGQPSCPHHGLIYSSGERRIWCRDCERTVDAFDAFQTVVNHFARMEAEAKAKVAKADEALRKTVQRRAAKEFERGWHGGALCCPHCRKGLLPEDFQSMSWVSREYEIARRKRDGEAK